MVILIAAVALVAGYGIGRAHHRDRHLDIDALVRHAYGRDVGHCEVNDTLTQEIRKTGGGQTAYLCGPARYSAIVNASGHVDISGPASAQP